MKLDTSMTLEKIREKLSQRNKNGKSIMKSDMYFCNKGGPYVIQECEEANIYLHEIIGDNNNLCIKRSEVLKEVMPRLIKEKKLDCGIYWAERGPKQSDNAAFKFIKEPEFAKHPAGFSKSEFKNNSEEFCENGIGWKFDLKVSWLPFTGSIGAHFAQRGSNGVEHKSRRIVEQYSRVTLFMKREHVKPSNEFRDDVEQALKLSSRKEKRDALIKVCETYGFFWASVVQLGGSIIKYQKEHKETNVQLTDRTMDANFMLESTPMGVGAGIKQNNETLNQNSFSNTEENSVVIGGHDQACGNDKEQWLKTLHDYFTWEIVCYENIVPIFEIFEESMRTAILEAFGPRICHYGIDELKPSRYPWVRQLKVKSDVWKQIHKHQVFAEVICDDKSNAIFAVNIEQMANGPPKAFVSKVRGHNSILPFGKTLKIAYIITGYPQSFSQAVDKFVEVDVVEGEKRDNKFVASLPKTPNIQDFDQRVVLVTCYVTKQTIFAVHLHKDDTDITEPTSVVIEVLTK
ncbi:3515_t:CDS:2 [Paraglomus occultum]|uniref:3515_t:CDS:1 n=1 Tax=Paraglomus occultum TaxID=144539 RepID=A0A9N8ZV77_9GLOM|nr:3515_t:CDS:2 [Paraglomus occultum]